MTNRSNSPGQSAIMEPRIRVRRAQVRRQEGRRRLRVVVAVLVCLCAAVAGWAATRSPLLDVDHIVVVGASQTPVGTVVTVGRVRRGMAMIDVDEGSVKRRVQALPWVRSASVRRHWPGTVAIRLVERTPVAMTANSSGSWALVDADARVLAWVPAPVPNLMVLAGLPAAGPPGTTLAAAGRGPLDVIRAIPAGLRRLVVNATVDGRGISLGVVPRGTILLGDAVDLDAKLRAAELVLSGVDLANLAVVDVRLPATPTVTRSQP